MIIKFDHVSFSGEYENASTILQLFSTYNTDFVENELANIEGKKELFIRKHEKHSIYMLRCEGKLPIELTLYDKCTNIEPMLNVHEDIIIIKSKFPDVTEELLVDLGFRKKENVLCLKPMMDKMEIRIVIEPTKDNYNKKLDNYGYSSLAFWVSNVVKDRQKYNDLGYVVTNIEKLLVNGRLLSIFFLVGHNGEIIEFIGMDKER